MEEEMVGGWGPSRGVLVCSLHMVPVPRKPGHLSNKIKRSQSYSTLGPCSGRCFGCHVSGPTFRSISE